MDNMTLSDIAAVMPKGNGGDGFLEGNGIIILILFFLIFGFGGGGFGANGNASTQAEVQRGFDTQAIVGKLDGITNGLSDTAYENARLIEQNTISNMQGFNQTQMGMMQGFNGVDKSLCQGFGYRNGHTRSDGNSASARHRTDAYGGTRSTRTDNLDDQCGRHSSQLCGKR